MFLNGTIKNNNQNLMQFIKQSSNENEVSRLQIMNTPPRMTSPRLTNSPSSNNNNSNRMHIVSPLNRSSPDNLSSSPTDQNRYIQNGSYQSNNNINQNHHNVSSNSTTNQCTISPPLKKSFCIDALLAKNQGESIIHENTNSEIDRFLKNDDDDDDCQRYDRSPNSEDGHLSRFGVDIIISFKKKNLNYFLKS